MAVLHHALTQQFVFPGKQLLNEIVTALVHVARCPGEMMNDPRSGRATEIIRNRKNFIGGVFLAAPPIRVRKQPPDRQKFPTGPPQTRKKEVVSVGVLVPP